MITAFANTVQGHIQRDKDLYFRWKTEPRRHYADDHVFLVVEVEIAVQGIIPTSKRLLPVLIAQHSNVTLTGLVIAFGKSASKLRIHSQHRKVGRFRSLHQHRLRLAVVTAICGGRIAIKCGTLERVVLALPIEVIGASERKPSG